MPRYFYNPDEHKVVKINDCKPGIQIQSPSDMAAFLSESLNDSESIPDPEVLSGTLLDAIKPIIRYLNYQKRMNTLVECGYLETSKERYKEYKAAYGNFQQVEEEIEQEEGRVADLPY